MTLTNAYRKLESANLQINWTGAPKFTATSRTHQIELTFSGVEKNAELSHFAVRNLTDIKNGYTDGSDAFFFDSLTQAIRFAK